MHVDSSDYCMYVNWILKLRRTSRGGCRAKLATAKFLGHYSQQAEMKNMYFNMFFCI